MSDIDVELYKYTKLFERIQNARKEWNDGEHARIYFSGTFYNGVYSMKNIRSGYVSRGAYDLPSKKQTHDHFLAPRLIFRGIMEEVPELIHDFDGLREVVIKSQTTVAVTKPENDSVRFDNNDGGFGIKMLTVEKYDSFGWYHKNEGFLMEYVNGQMVPKKFPLKHMVPEWLTAFEKKYLK